MFGFSKKKNKNAFNPTFGSAQDFANKYEQDSNNIIIINDRQESVDKDCVIPFLNQNNLSYVVYDPNGTYYNATAGGLKARGYDVQLIDLADTLNKTRIDLFEMDNIARNPYWTSLMLASSIKCNKVEVQAAHSLFMAMMQYLLASNQKIDIASLTDLFNKIVGGDRQIIRDVESCSSSKSHMIKFNSYDDATKMSVFDKINTKFFGICTKKINNPNVFAITAHKRQTAIFVKRVPIQYRSLVTIMLFNLKASGALCGDGAYSTVIIDSAEDEWYNRKMLARACEEIGDSMKKSSASVAIRKSVDPAIDLADHPLVVYMHTDDNATKEYVYNLMRVKNQMSEEELSEISKKHFKKKGVPAEVLESAPITMGEMDKISDCIIIDTTSKARPYRCESWIKK